jgi:hypothetical protein
MLSTAGGAPLGRRRLRSRPRARPRARVVHHVYEPEVIHVHDHTLHTGCHHIKYSCCKSGVSHVLHSVTDDDGNVHEIRFGLGDAVQTAGGTGGYCSTLPMGQCYAEHYLCNWRRYDATSWSNAGRCVAARNMKDAVVHFVSDDPSDSGKITVKISTTPSTGVVHSYTEDDPESGTVTYHHTFDGTHFTTTRTGTPSQSVESVAAKEMTGTYPIAAEAQFYAISRGETTSVQNVTSDVLRLQANFGGTLPLGVLKKGLIKYLIPRDYHEDQAVISMVKIQQKQAADNSLRNLNFSSGKPFDKGVYVAYIGTPITKIINLNLAASAVKTAVVANIDTGVCTVTADEDSEA